MDLNARPTRNFWDIFHCCRNISEEEENSTTKFSAPDNYAFTTMKVLNTKVNASTAGDLDTPTTVGTDFSFESQDSKLETINEDENIFGDDLSEVAMDEAEQEAVEGGEEFDLNEQDASFIYDKMTSLAEQQGEEDEDSVPDMDLHLNGTVEARTAKKDDTTTQKRSQAAAVEITFYQFFIFMILRHMFGSLLLRSCEKKKKNKTYWEKFLLLTNLKSNNEDDQSQKSPNESRRTMKLRQLKLDEGKCEVFPSLSDVPTIPEDKVLL